MPTVDEIRNRDNIVGEQIPCTPYYRLALVAPNGTATPLGQMTVTPRQMLALFRDPSNRDAILATSERMPADG